jgi:hypothetical protein
MANLRGIGQAMHLYAIDNHGQYPRTRYSLRGFPVFFSTTVRQRAHADAPAGKQLGHELTENRPPALAAYPPEQNANFSRAFPALIW